MMPVLKTMVIGIACFVISMAVFADTGSLSDRELLVMENDSAWLAIDLAGGTIADFHLKKQGLNPFTWNHPEKGDTAPRKMGHFICFDRWGAPTKAELANGMPYHGEATEVIWTVEKQPSSRNGKITAEVSCTLPMVQLKMNRTIILDDKDAVVDIREAISNIGKVGRLYNLIQHGSFAAPFLSRDIRIDTDVAKGFIQNGPEPGEPVIYWPHVAYDGKLVDLRKMERVQGPGVLSFTFPDEYTMGWITACNPARGLMVGYVWDTDDYPWLNMWRNFNKDMPAAFGIEFGTSGLHQPYPVLVATHEIFGRQLYEYLDAGEKTEKSYTLFLSEIPDTYTGTGDIAKQNGVLKLKEAPDGNGNTIDIDIR